MTTAFTSKSTRNVMHAACRQAGLDSGDATQMRFGENALYHLVSEGVVVRVARTMSYWDDVTREVAVSKWLHRAGMPAAQVVDEIEQPVAVDGHPVTFWRYIPGEPAPYSRIGDLGSLLSQLHRLSPPPELALTEQAILDRVRPRVEKAPIADSDRHFLLTRLDELADQVETLDYALQPCAVHGDAPHQEPHGLRRQNRTHRLRALRLWPTRVGPGNDRHRAPFGRLVES